MSYLSLLLLPAPSTGDITACTQSPSYSKQWPPWEGLLLPSSTMLGNRQFCSVQRNWKEFISPNPGSKLMRMLLWSPTVSCDCNVINTTHQLHLEPKEQLIHVPWEDSPGPKSVMNLLAWTDENWSILCFFCFRGMSKFSKDSEHCLTAWWVRKTNSW